MSYEYLQECVKRQDWDAAKRELENVQSTKNVVDDVLAILATTIYMEEGKREEAYAYIAEGLRANYKNYELYFLLGNYYENQNINQAWLCYENAEFYCNNAGDLELIRQYKLRLQGLEEWNVKRTCIIG